MNDLVQTGFFDAESSIGENDEIVISSDWMSLSDNDFRQAATEHHKELDQQETVINAIKNHIILEKGDLYMAAKTKLKHGQYLDWLEEIKVSADKAQTYTQIARDLREEIANADRGRHLSYRLWRGIVRSPERKQIVAKIESGEMEANSNAINAEIKAARKRAEEAEQQALAKAETAQQELFKLQSESHNTTVQLSKQIEDLQKQRDDRQKQISELQQQITTISTPEKEIVEKEVIPPDAMAKIAQNEQLQAQIAKLTEQRDNLSQLAQELGKDLDTLRDANEAKRARELQEARVLQNWRDVTNAFHKQVLKLLTQFPTPVDTQIFESEDWERLSQAESIASRFIAECNNLSRRSNSMIIESR